MSWQQKSIKVHKSLHDVFGKEPKVLDLLAIVLASIVLTLTTQWMALNLEMPLYKRIVLALLTLDIGGGVVANFTKSTNDYYAASQRKRTIFLLLHVVQPSILTWLFPSAMLGIAAMTFFTLLCAFLIDRLKPSQVQRSWASMAVLLGISLAFVLLGTAPVLQLIFCMYCIKLTLAFAVDWTHEG